MTTRHRVGPGRANNHPRWVRWQVGQSATMSTMPDCQVADVACRSTLVDRRTERCQRDGDSAAGSNHEVTTAPTTVVLLAAYEPSLLDLLSGGRLLGVSPQAGAS
jgi:hypothetical protein